MKILLFPKYPDVMCCPDVRRPLIFLRVSHHPLAEHLGTLCELLNDLNGDVIIATAENWGVEHPLSAYFVRDGAENASISRKAWAVHYATIAEFCQSRKGCTIALVRKDAPVFFQGAQRISYVQADDKASPDALKKAALEAMTIACCT